MQTTSKNVQLFKLLSSETRFRILSVLDAKSEDVCVNEIADMLKLSQSAISHQLRKLEDAGIVNAVRKGQLMCYQLANTDIARKSTYLLRL